VLKNTVWLSFGTLFGRTIKAILIIYIARMLGAAGYGVFSYVLNIAALFTIFSDIGISPILTREASRSPENLKRFLSTSLVIKLVLLSLGTLLIVFVGPPLTGLSEAIPLLPLAAVLAVFDGLREFTFSITRAREKMQTESIVNVITNVAVTVLGVLVLVIKPTSQNLLIAYTLGSGAGMTVSFFILRNDFREIFSFFDRTIVKKIIVEAWPFAIGGILGGIMINTDTLMIGWLKQAVDVGFYSAAQRPIQLLYIFPALFSVGLFPTLSRLANTNNERLGIIFEKAIKVSLFVALPMAIGGFVLAAPITVLLFGPEFMPAAAPLALLMLTLIMNFPGSLLGNLIFAYNRQKVFIISVALGAFSNAFFNYLLIPPYGLIGSSVATIIAQILNIGYLLFKAKQINNFRIFPHLHKIIIAVAGMGLLAYFLQSAGTNLFITVAASALFYFVALYWLKEPLMDKSLILDIFK
jgi:O-antigen/teichoic acid export membrane protein